MINLRLLGFERFFYKKSSVWKRLYIVLAVGLLLLCILSNAYAAPIGQIEKVAIYKQAEIVDIEQQADKVEINPQTDTIREDKLDEIIVTAYKASLPLKLSAKMVNIILPKQIERSPVKSIEDLLNYHSGVDVLQRGPHGVQADITLRGGSFD